MLRKRYRPEEIVAKLCETEVLLGQDKKLLGRRPPGVLASTTSLCRHLCGK